MLKFLLKNQEAHRQQSFEGHPTVEDLWTWIKIHANSFIKTGKYHETKINEGAMKIIISFSQKKLVFKSNPVFIDTLDSF